MITAPVASSSRSGPQLRRAASPRVPLEQLGQRDPIGQPPHFRLIECPLELPLEYRPARSNRRPEREVTGMPSTSQPRRPAGSPGVRSPERGRAAAPRHFDGRSPVGSRPHSAACRAMAQHRIGPAGEHGRHPSPSWPVATVRPRRRPMHAWSSPRATRPSIARVPSQAQQLAPRHHPMLRRQPAIARSIGRRESAFCRSMQSARLGHGPMAKATRGWRAQVNPPRRTQKRPQPAVTASGFDPLK